MLSMLRSLLLTTLLLPALSLCLLLGLAFYLFYRGMEFAERFPGLGGLLVERLLFVLFAFLFVLLLFSNFLPNPATQVPRVPYSLFIDQVNADNVKRAYITSDQIRYELDKPPAEGAPTVLATTPIFDMDLPQRLEQHGFAFVPPPACA